MKKKIIHCGQDGEYGKIQKQYRFQAALFIHLDFPKPFQTICRLKSCCPSKQAHRHLHWYGCVSRQNLSNQNHIRHGKPKIRGTQPPSAKPPEIFSKSLMSSCFITDSLSCCWPFEIRLPNLLDPDGFQKTKHKWFYIFPS